MFSHKDQKKKKKKRKKFSELDEAADLVGSSPFFFHPTCFYPEYPTDQARRWLVSYAFNYLQVKGFFQGNRKTGA